MPTERNLPMLSQHLSDAQGAVCQQGACPLFTPDYLGDPYCMAPGRIQGYAEGGPITPAERKRIPLNCPNGLSPQSPQTSTQ